MFMVGWDKQEIDIQPQGYAMFGYGMWSHRAYQKRTALFARTFTIRRLALEQPIIFCCLDFGCITYAIRSVVVERLKQQLAEQFNEQHLVLMATHTHSDLAVVL
jgi:neutral ceramidase